MKSFHFSLGNSTVGPIGYCARINAETQEEAVTRLKAMLPESVEVPDADLEDDEYIAVYFNWDDPKVTDIDEEEDIGPGPNDSTA